MIQEAIYFWASLATAIFSCISLAFIGSYKKFERERLVNGLNFLMLGICIIVVRINDWLNRTVLITGPVIKSNAIIPANPVPV